VVDYQPETDELALLQTLGGEAEEVEEEEHEEEGGDADMLEGDGGGVEAARRRRVSCWGCVRLRMDLAHVHLQSAVCCCFVAVPELLSWHLT
jgi:hypothetical protein